MEVKITYVGTLNGIKGIWCGFKPENAVIEEERLVLYPSENFNLRNKDTGEVAFSVWLNSLEQQDDWEEVEI